MRRSADRRRSPAPARALVLARRGAAGRRGALPAGLSRHELRRGRAGAGAVRHRRSRRRRSRSDRAARSRVAGDVRGSGGEAALVARFTSRGALDTVVRGHRQPAGSLRGRRRRRRGRQRADAVAVAPDGSTRRRGRRGRPDHGRALPARRRARRPLRRRRRRPARSVGRRGHAGRQRPRRDRAHAGRRRSSSPAASASPTGRSLRRGRAGRAGRRRPPQRPRCPGLDVRHRRLRHVIQLGARSARRPARSQAAALALGAGGTIVARGALERAGRSRPRARRAADAAAGRLDASFGRAGRHVVQLGRASAARRGELRAARRSRCGPTGRCVAAGRGTDVAGNGQVVLARFTVGGALDATLRPRRRRAHAGQRRDQARPAASPSARAIALTPDGTDARHRLDLARRQRSRCARAPPGGWTAATARSARGAGFGARYPRAPGDPGDRRRLRRPRPARRRATSAPGGCPAAGCCSGASSAGPAAPRRRPARRPGLRTLGARYLGRGPRGRLRRGAGATARRRRSASSRAPPRAARGRAITHAPRSRVSGAFGAAARVRDRAWPDAGAHLPRADRLARRRAGRSAARACCGP